MTQPPDSPRLSAVPDLPDGTALPDAEDPDRAEDASMAEQPGPDGEAAGDPLLAAAERIGELPLGERPAALQRLNAALVEELNALEEV